MAVNVNKCISERDRQDLYGENILINGRACYEYPYIGNLKWKKIKAQNSLEKF